MDTTVAYSSIREHVTTTYLLVFVNSFLTSSTRNDYSFYDRFNPPDLYFFKVCESTGEKEAGTFKPERSLPRSYVAPLYQGIAFKAGGRDRYPVGFE